MKRDLEPPAIVREDVDLKSLAGRIVARHQRSLTDMRDNGLDLAAAQKKCHDKGIGWGKWLAENVGMSRMHAHRLMELAGRNCNTVLQLEQVWEEICGRAKSWACDVCGEVVDGCDRPLVHCHNCGYHFMNLTGVCTNCHKGSKLEPVGRLERSRGDPPDAGRVPVLDGDTGEPVGFWAPPDPAADPPGEVEQLDDRPHVHVAQNSGEQEWYTPPEYLDAARAVMGGFDLDPATSEAAQRTVRARRYYTKEANGLEQAWEGRVWMNPPYASGLVDQFVGKLAAHVRAGEVTEAVVLVNNATETRWFREAAAVASAVCFPTGRVRFVSPDGNVGAPLQGQAVLYVGRRKGEFIRAFAAFGFCAEIAP